MTDALSFSETVRSFMDFFMDRSMRGWKRFARDSGLSMAQFSIIMQLHYRGSCTISDISERFETTSAAASQLAEKLVQAGFMQRAEDPTDRRSRLLTLSPKGQDLVEQSIRERYRWVEELGSHLAPEEQQKIIEGLTLMTLAAQNPEPSR
jgi:DNA-binding MarR family transcriptional regulator